MKHAIITGASGFIGRALCQHLAANGWKVSGLVRRAPATGLPGVEYFPYDLDQPIAAQTAAAMDGADALIHLAYIAGEPRPLERNVEGTARLLAATEKVRKRIFISSFSASADAESVYGQQKFQVEQLFAREGDVSLRLGVVMGRGGGLFERTLQLLEKLPVVPLIDSGWQPVQVIRVVDLARVLEFVAQNPVPPILPVASPDVLTIRELYAMLARKLGLKKVFLPVPMLAVYPPAWLAEKLGVRLPITTENLKGLRSARKIDVSETQRLLPFAIPDAKTAVEAQEL